MGWMGLGELDDDTRERAVALKRYAQEIMRAYHEGRITNEQAAEHLDGLGDDMDAAFTPAQRAVLRKLTHKLRKYSRKVAKFHDHGPGTPLGRLRLPTRRRKARRITDLPVSGWESDDREEMGFLPLLASIAAPLIGGLLGGGKSEAPPPASAPAPPVIVSGNGGGAVASNVSLPAIGGVVADQIRAVPPPVRQQVTDAIRESLDRMKSGQQDVSQLLADIKQQLGPSINAQMSAVNKAALQRQATFEHEALNRSNKRWKDNADAQRMMLSRINDVEAKLGAAIESTTARRNAVARAFGIPPRYQG